MKWTVLGYQSPYPGPGGATPGYLLTTDTEKILIDCGSGVISQLGKYVDPWSVDAVVLSHLHNDHMVDVPILHYALLMGKISGNRTTPMPIYAPSEPKEVAKGLSYENYVEFKDILSMGTTTEILGTEFQFFRTQHDVPCVAMKITREGKSICYSADAGPETDWSSFGTDMDLIVVEGTFLDRDIPKGKRGHLSVAEAAQLATRLRAKKCVITHLYPLYDRQEILGVCKENFNGEIYVAEIGLTVEV